MIFVGAQWAQQQFMAPDEKEAEGRTTLDSDLLSPLSQRESADLFLYFNDTAGQRRIVTRHTVIN